jgi:hypothetical protein
MGPEITINSSFDLKAHDNLASYELKKKKLNGLQLWAQLSLGENCG